jgi:hypothetical protein
MTRDDRDWLTDDFPELRDSPPWVMEEMIFAQASPQLGRRRARHSTLLSTRAPAAPASRSLMTGGPERPASGWTPPSRTEPGPD